MPNAKDNNPNSRIQSTYFELLNGQQFVADKLDYTILENHKKILESIANIGNSGISVFDFYRKEHVFYSSNFVSFLGYNNHDFSKEDQNSLDQRIHPEDFLELMKNGISLFKLSHQFSAEEKYNYKLINEFRILNPENQYIRVIEQHKILELDFKGNLWLALSIIDISPNQNKNDGFKCQFLNTRTGKTIPFQDENKNHEPITPILTKRESQILKMVRNGFLSKEISNKLGISLHTVNTHRQRVLEKLDANNSMEAIAYASKHGLI